MKFILSSIILFNLMSFASEPISGGKVNKKLLAEIKKNNLEMIAKQKDKKAEDQGRAPASLTTKD